MADDTRLAEACLLLNYSNQSRREQLSPSGGTRQEDLDCNSTMFSGSDNRSLAHLDGIKLALREGENSLASCDVIYQPSRSVNSNNDINSIAADIDNIKYSSQASKKDLHDYRNGFDISTANISHPPNLQEHDYCLKFENIETSLKNSDSQETLLCPTKVHSDLKYSKSITPRLDCNLVRAHSDSNIKPNVYKEMTSHTNIKLIAIHLGAGKCHNVEESKKIAKSVCEKVMFGNLKSPNKHGKESQYDHSKQDFCAVDAVVKLIEYLEDHQALNCGFGSNLNIKGQVECDASLMSDQTQLWAGVGALSGCKNPIILAKTLYDFQMVPRPLNLIQPNLLVGVGAKQWMREHCPHLSVVDSKMISSRSFSLYQKLKSKYDAAVRENSSQSNSIPPVDFPTKHDHLLDNNKKSCDTSTNLDHGFYCMNTRENLKKVVSFAEVFSANTRECDNQKEVKIELVTGLMKQDEEINEYLCNARLDTVGAIAVDSNNNFATAVSSGGLLLKCRGRVGQAAVPGAGCWAEDSVAATTTGLGEVLTLNLFAKKFYDKINTLRLLYDLGHVERKQDLSNLITCKMGECFEDLAKSSGLAHIYPQDRLAGMLAVSALNSHQSPERVDSNDLYLSFGHNTNSMCIGYMTCNDTVAKSIISRRCIGGNENKAFIETMKFSFDQNKSCGNER